MTIIENKSEILFLYDVTDANPNGDPLDENKPRIDEETGQNIVTDVRLKRTIRDYLYSYKGFNAQGPDKKDIFVREIADDTGKIQDGKARARDFEGSKESILERCIDIRLFGGTIPLENDSIKLTGPVQFKMGRSLHPVIMKHIQGTSAFASREGLSQASFREEDILYYSLVGFHGIINPAAAKHSLTTENDTNLLMEGIWEGTKNLITRSKFGQVPRMLLKVNYNSPLPFIGDLDRLISLKTEKPFERIRSIADFQIETALLQKSLDSYSAKISSIEYLMDPNLSLCIEGNKVEINDVVKDIVLNPISFN